MVQKAIKFNFKWMYTRLEQEENLVEDSIFCENNIWRSDNFGFRTVEIRNFTRIRQKILR